MSPVYGPEDLIYTSNRKKRKLRCISYTTERPATSAETMLDSSDADDEDDIGQPCVETPALHQAAPPPPPNSAPTCAPLVQSAVVAAPGQPSPDPASQDGPSLNGTAAHVEARAVLCKIELTTTVCVSGLYREAMIEQSLALGRGDTLDEFLQACRYLQSHLAPRPSQMLALSAPQDGLILREGGRPALDEFARAYHAAETTSLHRTVSDVIYRAELAHVHDAYLLALEALSPRAIQEMGKGGLRPRDAFNGDTCTTAKDQMYFACYPDQQGVPCSSNSKQVRKFKTRLEHAEKWHGLRNELGIGMLALVPRGGNTWFEKLPFKALPVYFHLIAAVNRPAVEKARLSSDWVLSMWRREPLPEHLPCFEAADEVSLQLEPAKLLSQTAHVGQIQRGRATTVPAGVDEKDVTALGTVFSR